MAMTILEWGAVGELVGGAAVIVTLIYLAFQLRQNTKSLEASALAGWLSARIAINEAVSRIGGETLQRGMRDSRSLT